MRTIANSPPTATATQSSPTKSAGVGESAVAYQVIRSWQAASDVERHDENLVREVVAAYLRLGLFGPARELVAAGGDFDAGASQPGQLARELARKPSGRVA